jgi:cell division protein FtsN
MAQKKTKSSSTPKKKWKIEFGLFGLLGLGTVGTLVMAWAFILGILVGRGYKPESVIPDLGRAVSPLSSTMTKDPPRTVLQPEELRFFETLQERGNQPIPSVPRRSEPPRAQTTPRSTVQEAQQPAQAQSAPTVQAPPAVVAPSTPQFEFVYQVASFQNNTQARALQQSIIASGISATVESSIVNGRQWYRVLVFVRGSQAEAEHAKTQLQRLGIADPFLRAKKSL